MEWMNTYINEGCQGMKKRGEDKQMQKKGGAKRISLPPDSVNHTSMTSRGHTLYFQSRRPALTSSPCPPSYFRC
jgi:hypothetical protein